MREVDRRLQTSLAELRDRREGASSAGGGGGGAGGAGTGLGGNGAQGGSQIRARPRPTSSVSDIFYGNGRGPGDKRDE